MFSIFPASPSRFNIQQENNIQARKPGNSTRKPFADRKVGENVASKPILQEKPPQKLNEVKDDFSYIDICSYKDEPDTYNDAMGPKDYNLVSYILSGKYTKTPEPKKHHFEPELIKNESLNFKFIESPAENLGFFEIDDAPLPELDFVF